jgi:hypothetical protein
MTGVELTEVLRTEQGEAEAIPPSENTGTVAVQLAFGLHMFQANTCAAAGRIQSQGIER